MKKIEEKKTHVIYERSISLKVDKYLDGHRFGSTPYFPFVMGIEFFCQACRDITQSFDAVLFSTFRILNPIMLRKDRDKTVLVRIDNCAYGDENQLHLITVYDEQGTTYISGELTPRETLRINDILPSNLEKKTTMFEEKISEDLFYKKLFPHGPHFQSQFEILFSARAEWLIRQYGFNNKLEYINDEKISNLITQPVLLDGIMQLCSYISVKKNNCFLLPVSVASCFIRHSLKNKVDDVYVHIVEICRTVFDVVVYDVNTKKIFVELRGLSFVELKKAIPS